MELRTRGIAARQLNRYAWNLPSAGRAVWGIVTATVAPTVTDTDTPH
jgi:hypothetical protein